MRALDLVDLAVGSLREHRLRSALSALGVAIGVGAVVLLTSIGSGVRSYVAGEFSQFGTDILQVTPGRTETFGIPGAMGGTTHPLTIDDAEALRRVYGVAQVVPVAFGNARVAHGELGRSVPVYGVTSEAPEVWRIGVRQGSFLPAGDPRRSAAVCVLGPKLAQELFGERNPVGSFVRVAGWRLRVVGVMESKGQVLGFDIDDVAWVPTATALQMFDLDQLVEIDVTPRHGGLVERVREGVRAVLIDRHDGGEDFTIQTQDEMLSVLDEVLRVISLGVVAIGAVSLLVGAVGILTLMWIAVGERTHEIGLLRALGASVGQVFALFLLESAALAGAGGAAGLAGSVALARLLGLALPAMPVETPWTAAAAALAGSILTGLAAGAAPARRAARLDPVEALRAE